MGIERLFSLDIGSWGETTEDKERDEQHRELLEEWRDRMAGITRIDPSRPEDSIEKMNRWIENGPAIGIKYSGGRGRNINCSHSNNYAIIERARELNAVIYIHTWIKVGGEPRYANKLSKVYDANLTEGQRKLVFGKNLREIAAPIMRRKGYAVEI